MRTECGAQRTEYQILYCLKCKHWSWACCNQATSWWQGDEQRTWINKLDSRNSLTTDLQLTHHNWFILLHQRIHNSRTNRQQTDAKTTHNIDIVDATSAHSDKTLTKLAWHARSMLCWHVTSSFIDQFCCSDNLDRSFSHHTETVRRVVSMSAGTQIALHNRALTWYTARLYRSHYATGCSSSSSRSAPPLHAARLQRDSLKGNRRVRVRSSHKAD